MPLTRCGALDVITHAIWPGTLILLPLAPRHVGGFEVGPQGDDFPRIPRTFPTTAACVAWA
jgi:hypothetical protein